MKLFIKTTLCSLLLCAFSTSAQLQQTELLQGLDLTNTLVYLQPISQKAKATQLAIEFCKQHNWRLSVQVHKYLGIN